MEQKIKDKLKKFQEDLKKCEDLKNALMQRGQQIGIQIISLKTTIQVLEGFLDNEGENEKEVLNDR